MNKLLNILNYLTISLCGIFFLPTSLFYMHYHFNAYNYINVGLGLAMFVFSIACIYESFKEYEKTIENK